MRDPYAKLRKTERNGMLFQLVEEHPNLTLKEIGRVFNISKQRVSELLKIERLKNEKAAEPVKTQQP
jgi:predicted transcriptional regulator